jgi:hypothetical protein
VSQSEEKPVESINDKRLPLIHRRKFRELILWIIFSGLFILFMLSLRATSKKLFALEILNSDYRALIRTSDIEPTEKTEYLWKSIQHQEQSLRLRTPNYLYELTGFGAILMIFILVYYKERLMTFGLLARKRKEKTTRKIYLFTSSPPKPPEIH